MVAIEDLAPAWMPPTIAQYWLTEYTLAGAGSVPGAGQVATEMVRRDPKYRDVYDAYFPGNRREDGSLRLTEERYYNRKDSYRNALMGVNVNPDLFEDQMAGLIAGDVDESEFTTRVESMYERVLESSTDIRDFYAANYGLDLTQEAIVASFLDPDVGNAVLNRQIAVSEIGGEAAIRGFDVDIGYAEELEQTGMRREQAQALFGRAGLDVETLNVLARRHADPDDTFDLEEFTRAEVFDDPIQRRRMRRLVAQERSSFTGAGSLAEDRRTGGITGLRER
jgi:hypothetical protein